jgi:pimeloyl-ACP methyl ester carboxylesterase
VERFSSEDGVEIVYDTWEPAAGTPAAGPPVVLHHGFVADAYVNWVAPGVVDALTQAGRRVVALDARGHGRSGKPHDPAAYGEDTMARDLSALFDLVVGPDGAVDLVGYSMGAIVALIAAGRDRRVRRLVAGGVGAGVVELGGVDTRVIPTDALIDALLADHPAAIAAPGAAEFRAVADAVGADRFALAAHARAVHAEPLPLDRITAPTLVLAGASDPLADRPEVLAAAVPGAELRLVAGDHLTAVGDPAFAPAIVEFLAR